MRKASSVYIHKHSSNNFKISDDTQRKIGSNTNRSLISTSQNLAFDDASVLSMGLKNLQLKQQERQYSGVKSLRMISSIDDAKSNQKLVQSVTNINENSEKISPEKPLLLAPVKNDGFTYRDFLNDQNESSALNCDKRNMTLIERLEKQKEATNLLLEKSKSKHSQMISQSIYTNNTQNQTDKLNIYFSTIKN